MGLLDLPSTRSIALTPDDAWFVDLQWYRKMEQEDLFLKSVYCMGDHLNFHWCWNNRSCELFVQFLVYISFLFEEY